MRKRNSPEVFLGRKAKGETWKFTNATSSNVPAMRVMRPSFIPLFSFWRT